jgi:hypothetical protein
MAIHTKALINIYIYQGTLASYTDADLKYTLNKDRLPGQEDIVIEIGELIRDYLDNGFNGTEFIPVTRWVTIRAALYGADGNEISGSPKEYNYLAVDGYGMFEDGINPELDRHVLQSNLNIYVPEGQNAKIPVFAESLSYVTFYNSAGGNVGNVTVNDTGNTSQKVQYITVPTNCTKVFFDSVNEDKTVYVNYVCENIYDPVNLTFINKYGAHQQIWFFKKNVKKLSITDNTFNRNIINISNRGYSINAGQSQRYNVNAKTSISVNTGYVEEEFNAVIEEMLLSEKVWIKQGAQTLPVIPQSKSLQYKTDINDKVQINYSFDFEFAFNKINLVR